MPACVAPVGLPDMFPASPDSFMKLDYSAEVSGAAQQVLRGDDQRIESSFNNVVASEHSKDAINVKVGAGKIPSASGYWKPPPQKAGTQTSRFPVKVWSRPTPPL